MLTSTERNLVVALLRCAADPGSNLHFALSLVRPTGRLAREAWAAFFAADCNPAAAAAALENARG